MKKEGHCAVGPSCQRGERVGPTCRSEKGREKGRARARPVPEKVGRVTGPERWGRGRGLRPVFQGVFPPFFKFFFFVFQSLFEKRY